MKQCCVCFSHNRVRTYKKINLCRKCKEIPEIHKILNSKQSVINWSKHEVELIDFTKVTKIRAMRSELCQILRN